MHCNSAGHSAASPLELTCELWHGIIDYLKTELPWEGVGLLSILAEPGRLTAASFYPGRNRDASATRYTMDPGDVLAALQEMERLGTRLGAVVHSHPRTPPVPSEFDLVEATLPGVLSVIVGLWPRPSVRAWSLVFDQRCSAVEAIEVPVVLRAGAPEMPLRPASYRESAARRHR